MFLARSTSGSRSIGHGLYSPIVVALAIFLAVVAIGRVDSGRFLASARLEGTVDSKASPRFASDEISRQLTDPRFVRDAMVHGLSHGIETRTLSSAATIVDTLAIEIEPTKADGQFAIRLDLTLDDPETSKAIVNSICDHFVQEQSSLACPSSERAARDRDERAARAVADAEQHYTTAQRALRAFLSEHIDELRQVPSSGLREFRDAAYRTRPASPPQATFASLAANAPNLADLRSQRARLNQKRAALLETMTTNHPTVLDLDQRIGQVQQQLAAAESWQAEERLEAERRAAQNRRELRDEFQRLNDAVDQAANGRVTARETERHAWERKSDERPSIAWRLLPAVNVHRVPEPISRASLLLGMALGMFGAVGTVIVQRRARTIDSAADAETVFQTAVVGTVTDSDAPRVAEKSGLSRRVRMVIATAELVLLVAIGAMIVAALIDRDFGNQLRADPLSALVDGPRQLLQTLLH